MINEGYAKLKSMGTMSDIKINWRQGLLFATITLVIVIADQISKALVRDNMYLGESIPDEGKFRFTYSTNSGSVFGLDINSTFLLIMGIIVLAVLLWLNFVYLKSAGRFMRVGLGLVMGGAIGNLIDRIRFGEVTDFIDVNLGFWPLDPWPIFNIADSALTIGIFILIYSFMVLAAKSK